MKTSKKILEEVREGMLDKISEGILRRICRWSPWTIFEEISAETLGKIPEYIFKKVLEKRIFWKIFEKKLNEIFKRFTEWIIGRISLGIV